MDDADRPPPGPGQVLRLLLPAFAISTVIVVIGVILAAAHHRTLGIIFVVIGAVGGLAVRAQLMSRSQLGRRSRRPDA